MHSAVPNSAVTVSGSASAVSRSAQRVVVIGAGIIGLAIAYELRRRGHDVEVRSVGIAEGATFAAAGMLAPAAEIQLGQNALWPIMREAMEDHRALAADIASRTGKATGYRDDSTLVIGRDRADLAEIRETGAAQCSSGAHVTDITASRARRLEPALAPGISGGQLIDGDSQVDPRILAMRLVELLIDPVIEAPPARIIEGRVHDLERIDADRIILAAALGVGEIAGPHRRLTLSLRAVRGDIIRVQVPQSMLLPGESHLISRTIRGMVRGRHVYLVPRDGGELVIGATSREDSLAQPQTGGVLQLLQDAAELVPAIRETALCEVTARDRPGTPDDLPLLGPVPGDPRVILATGFHRHGVLLSAWAARRTADLVEMPRERWGHQPSSLEAVRPDRFTTKESA